MTLGYKILVVLAGLLIFLAGRRDNPVKQTQEEKSEEADE